MAQIIKKVKSKIKKILKAILPTAIRNKMAVPWVGQVDFGDLRRLEPIDPHFGYSRGKVIDRYYIEKFLADHAQDIRGRVLELGDSTYTKKFGGNKVTQMDVLNYVAGSPEATIIGDLTKADNIDSNIFDCIILTQTLQMIYDFRVAIKNLYRILKPDGVLLVTSHGTSKICRFVEIDPWGEYWRFTGQSVKLVFEDSFGPGNVKVVTYGNVLAATAFLQGLSVGDLTHQELNYQDPRYEVIVGVRTSKSTKLNR